ncbi:unnamed protein product [Pleuronectes platessa]|uniref:Uncharacterized protein n=1 Tax=Pleuronectes platessa TaxID=8262 RepID=A0A9N7ZBH1_PLEPL|nr:unnamed protein product [Pleuronectes platessa]
MKKVNDVVSCPNETSQRSINLSDCTSAPPESIEDVTIDHLFSSPPQFPCDIRTRPCPSELHWSRQETARLNLSLLSSSGELKNEADDEDAASRESNPDSTSLSRIFKPYFSPGCSSSPVSTGHLIQTEKWAGSPGPYLTTHPIRRQHSPPPGMHVLSPPLANQLQWWARFCEDTSLL